MLVSANRSVDKQGSVGQIYYNNILIHHNQQFPRINRIAFVNPANE